MAQDERAEGDRPAVIGGVGLGPVARDAVLDALVRRAPVGLAFLDLELRYVVVNEALAEVNDVSPEAHLGRSVTEVAGAQVAAEAEPVMREVLATGVSQRVSFEAELGTRPGKVRHFVEDFMAVDGPDGERLGLLALVEEVTEQVEADARRRVLEGELEVARRLDTVGQLAGGVAHDFNNLLAVIGLRAELLARRHPDLADVVDNVTTIERAVGQARDLAQRLLTFSRREHLAHEVVAIDEAVTRLEGVVRSLAGTEVEVAIELGAPAASVFIDPGALDQVVMNLVVNARDAMPGGGRLVISTTLVDADEVELVVADDGEGMAPDVAAHAFDPFFSTKRAGVGTGLGLSTVYGVITGAEGTVTLDTAPGEGTRVVVRLPLTEVPAPAVPTEDLGPPAGQHPLVLVVDDELDVTRVVADALRGAGYEVEVATSSPRAHAVIEASGGALALLLTDVRMPGGSGPELARAARAARPDLPVLFMSAFTGTEEERGALPTSTRVLRKPFTVAELLRAVHGALPEATATG